MDSGAVTRVSSACLATSGGLVRLAYPARPQGSHKGVPLHCAFGVPREDRRGGALGVHLDADVPEGNLALPHAVPQRIRRGTPLWLPRCGVGYAKRAYAPRRARWIPTTT